MSGASGTDETPAYRDRWIECTAGEIRVHGYYFPWAGTKHIPYSRVRGLDRVEMSALHGKGRIWGTGNFKYWANLDPKRPGKSVALILDIGRRVMPFITPDDPDAVEAIIRSRAGLPDRGGPAGRSPFV
jgi:hypothetical protein